MRTAELTASFSEELARWLPGESGLGAATVAGVSQRSITLGEAEGYCRRFSRAHYENFSLVSWLLPRRLHQHFYNLYAFCRWADDLADEAGSPQRSLELLAWWRTLLADCYQGAADHPVYVALRKTIAQFEIPSTPFENLITAFEQDQQVCEYATFSDLLGYCAFSANPVGRLVLHVCGHYNDANVDLSDRVCTGLQLANFWQDVSRDLDIGRIYLPLEDCERFGYTRAELLQRVTNDAFLQLMQYQVDRTRRYLEAVYPLAAALPGRLQVDIELFGQGGLKILDRIASMQFRVWDQRPVVTRWDACGLFLRSIGRLALHRNGIIRCKAAKANQ